MVYSDASVTQGSKGYPDSSATQSSKGPMKQIHHPGDAWSFHSGPGHRLTHLHCVCVSQCQHHHRAHLEGKFGGQIWRANLGLNLEGKFGGQIWGGKFGGQIWRANVEGKFGGQTWKANLEGKFGEQTWRVNPF